MLPYESVIRKRLRLKGHPELPPYADAPPAAPDPEPDTEADAPQQQSPPTTQPSKTDAPPPLTQAQLRHERAMLEREEARIRQHAEKSYKQNLQEFNTKLAEEPDHYDMFKTSFTK